MKIGHRRIRFIWGASKVLDARWRLGLVGFYEHVKGHPSSGLAFSIRGLLSLFLLLAVLAYVCGATVLYFWLDRRPHNFVTYSDTLLLPLRMEQIREKRGRGYIEEGIDDLKAQRWSRAEMKLRVGLSRYPQDIRARLHLAQFYQLAQRRSASLKLLRDGLELAKDYPGRRYLDFYFMSVRQGEEHEHIVAACELSRVRWPQLAATEKDWLLQQQFIALLALNQADTVALLLNEAAITPQNREMRVLALLNQQQVAAAATYLDEWAARDGTSPQVLRLQVRVFRENGQLEKMDAALEALRVLTPNDPNPYAYAIVQRALAGDEAAARASLRDYFLRFGANERATQLLAAPLGEINAAGLLEDLIARLTEQGHDRRSALQVLAQLHMRQGNWSEATAKITLIQQLPARTVTVENESAQILLETLITVLADPAEGPRLQLLELLNRQLLPLRGYRMIIDALLKAGRDQTALDVIARAERHYADSPTLVAYQQEAQRALAAAQAEVVVSLPRAQEQLGESVFFNQLDAAIVAANWSEAADMLRVAQSGKPAWFNARQPDLLSRQMRVAHETGEGSEMVLAARLLLDGSLAKSQLVVDYATALRAQGQTAAAVLLLREVQRKTPAHALSRRLLTEWTASVDPATVNP